MIPKRLIFAWLLSLSTLVAWAQGSNIQFSLLRTAQTDIPASVAGALDTKLKAMLTRNSAAAGGSDNVFVIEPVLEAGESLSAEGPIRQVTMSRGELTLLAKNKVDGSLYYSLTLSLRGHSAGNIEQALRSMVDNIKVTDKRFTRFIRLARQKIDDYYAANCATILLKAKALHESGRTQEAISYLSAVSAALPCYEQAAALMAEIKAQEPQPRDTIVIRRRVPVAQPQNDVSKPLND